MGNGLAQTPLHLAVGWPEGIRLLLQYGACVDSRDHAGDTPLSYALNRGYPQTVSLLMKADCSLVGRRKSSERLPRNVLDLAVEHLHSPNEALSPDVAMKVLDTTIASLAERRRDLQSRLTGLPAVVSTDTTVLREDRILDEYAEYAECAEQAAHENIDHIPRRASTLLNGTYLGKCRTVYHIIHLVVEVAEKLWENGFRDIDVPDDDGLTPLASCKHSGTFEVIELYSWLIQKGANLYRPQHRLNSPEPAVDPTELPQTTRALHYVAANIAEGTFGMVAFHGSRLKLMEYWLSRESKDVVLLLATVFSDGSSDDCICACSSRGCLASTLMLKIFEKRALSSPHNVDMRDCLARSIECLMIFVGPQNSSWDWLAKEIIRFRTFHELELRHTCCWFSDFGRNMRLVKFEEEERVEIQDEDKEKIELLENLLLEFEEHRGTQDLISFLEGYWAVRMDEVLEELNCGVDEEGLRGMGVVLEEDSDDDSGSEDDIGENHHGVSEI
ncbi:hypothetical protein BDR22DRAFT_875771 [Usnea florida]